MQLVLQNNLPADSQFYEYLDQAWRNCIGVSREEIIRQLQQNEPNGCYTDEACDGEAMPRVADWAEAVQLVAGAMCESSIPDDWEILGQQELEKFVLWKN